MYEMRHYIESHPNAKEWKDQAALNEMLAKDTTLKHRINAEVPQVGAGVDFELLSNSLTFESRNPQLPGKDQLISGQP